VHSYSPGTLYFFLFGNLKLQLEGKTFNNEGNVKRSKTDFDGNSRKFGPFRSEPVGFTGESHALDMPETMCDDSQE
jgi:hypothetical protein